MLSTTQQEILDKMKEKGCEIILPIPTSKNAKVTYVCKCGEEFTRIFKDFARRNCRKCKSLSLRELPKEDSNHESINEEGEKEIWKPVVGGWVSSLGNAKNVNGQQLILCKTKYRYHIGGKNQYVSRLVAIAFQIDDYEKLLGDDSKYGVNHIDGDYSNNRVENLRVVTKGYISAVNGSKSRQSETFIKKMGWKADIFKHIQSKVVKELKNHRIYANGEIWNGKRFLTFSSNNDGYLSFSVDNISYKVHRVVCYAFHPIEGKNSLSDYDDLQVNHINGVKSDNNYHNLEWMTRSENIAYNYKAGLNKRVKPVLALDKDTMEIVDKYSSIATASKDTGEPEHRISSSANGRSHTKSNYIWAFYNDEEYWYKIKGVEYRKRFEEESEEESE